MRADDALDVLGVNFLVDVGDVADDFLDVAGEGGGGFEPHEGRRDHGGFVGGGFFFCAVKVLVLVVADVVHESGEGDGEGVVGYFGVEMLFFFEDFVDEAEDALDVDVVVCGVVESVHV